VSPWDLYNPISFPRELSLWSRQSLLTAFSHLPFHFVSDSAFPFAWSVVCRCPSLRGEAFARYYSLRFFPSQDIGVRNSPPSTEISKFCSTERVGFPSFLSSEPPLSFCFLPLSLRILLLPFPALLFRSQFYFTKPVLCSYGFQLAVLTPLFSPSLLRFFFSFFLIHCHPPANFVSIAAQTGPALRDVSLLPLPVLNSPPHTLPIWFETTSLRPPPFCEPLMAVCSFYAFDLPTRCIVRPPPFPSSIFLPIATFRCSPTKLHDLLFPLEKGPFFSCSVSSPIAFQQSPFRAFIFPFGLLSFFSLENSFPSSRTFPLFHLGKSTIQLPCGSG